ncbi:MAG TPA: FixH family protein [Cyclobacteriaceae bacterium]
MNWGKWIIVTFLLFAAFIGTLVTVCMRQEVSLVSKDYYKEELAFQNQITRLQNSNSLLQKPEISVKQNELEITYDQLSKIENGKLVLFCPSNPRHDRKIIIEASSNEKQHVPIQDMQSGMYHARFSWSVDGKEYYIEKIITL